MVSAFFHTDAHLRAECCALNTDNARLKARIHDAYEVFANMDGSDFDDPKALMRVINDMVAGLKPLGSSYVFI